VTKADIGYAIGCDPAEWVERGPGGNARRFVRESVLTDMHNEVLRNLGDADSSFVFCAYFAMRCGRVAILKATVDDRHTYRYVKPRRGRIKREPVKRLVYWWTVEKSE